MSSSVTDQVQAEVRRDATLAALDRDPVSSSGSIERWLGAHLDGIALTVVAVGFFVRLLEATRSYFNPDEAMHYQILNQVSAFQAYKASLANAHPPLIFLLIYFWHLLGRSELMLRLPSVLAGTAFCWAAYQWIKIVFGRAPALIGVIFCAFAPALIALSAELRGYALLLCCAGAALYHLARAFDEKVDEKSARQMWYFSCFLYLAILTHYSAVFFTVALGVYALARIADSRLPRKAVFAWAAGQAGALAIYVFLYVTHISKIKTNIANWAMPFDPAYFHQGNGNIFTFTQAKTLDIFLFLFGQRFVAGAMLLFFVAGVAFLFVRDLAFQGGSAGSRRSGMLFLLPFAAVWGASLAGIYPYIGSRHTVFLAPFAIAAASFAIATVSRRKLWAGLLLATVLMAAANLPGAAADASGIPVEGGVAGGSNSFAWMAAAMNHMHQSIPRGSNIMVDAQSNLPLSYYLCGPRTIIPADTYQSDYFRFDCNGYSIISLHLWKLIEGSFPPQFKRMAIANGLKPGDRVWIFQAGWGENLGVELPKRDPKFRCLAPSVFGENISVFPVVVGPDLSPVAASPGC
jgi:4-amino-4-deoxy-L-arabinose transferase-like glycosyltransferase